MHYHGITRKFQGAATHPFLTLQRKHY